MSHLAGLTQKTDTYPSANFTEGQKVPNLASTLDPSRIWSLMHSGFEKEQHVGNLWTASEVQLISLNNDPDTMPITPTPNFYRGPRSTKFVLNFPSDFQKELHDGKLKTNLLNIHDWLMSSSNVAQLDPVTPKSRRPWKMMVLNRAYYLSVEHHPIKVYEERRVLCWACKFTQTFRLFVP